MLRAGQADGLATIAGAGPPFPQPGMNLLLARASINRNLSNLLRPTQLGDDVTPQRGLHCGLKTWVGPDHCSVEGRQIGQQRAKCLANLNE